MHSVSAQSSSLSWGDQLGKSVFLVTSSVGLGWLVSRLWKGVDEQPISLTENNGQLTIYKEIQNGSHWSNAEPLSMESSEIFECELQLESSFHKVGIVYKNSVQEIVKSSALSAENSNFHVLLARSLVGGLLVGRDISRFPLMVPLLALSLSKSIEAFSNGDDTPVGTVIATFSRKRPENYLRCDGAQYSINDYPELYDALGEEYRVVGGIFRVPDCEDFFLRGTNDVSKIGKKSEDTTRMPRQPFRLLNSGIHTHSASSAGEHKHESDSAGEHKHESDSAGEHTHTIDSAGEHAHSISATGLHQHKIHSAGDHTHPIHHSGQHTHTVHNAGDHSHGMNNAGKHDHALGGYYVLKRDGKYTMSVWDDHNPSGTEPNLAYGYKINWDGDHTHGIHSNGVHSHGMSQEGSHVHKVDSAGGHEHGMSQEGNHVHNIEKAASHTHGISVQPSHTHGISVQPSHSHPIQSSGAHIHEISESGSHVHEIVGGDAETSPKNIKVAYLIKAKNLEVTSICK